MKSKRFSKAIALEALEKRAERIAVEQLFDRNNGTSQIMPRNSTDPERSRIARAVQYGRMIALEEFAQAIDDGFAIDALDTLDD